MEIVADGGENDFCRILLARSPTNRQRYVEPLTTALDLDQRDRIVCVQKFNSWQVSMPFSGGDGVCQGGAALGEMAARPKEFPIIHPSDQPIDDQ